MSTFTLNKESLIRFYIGLNIALLLVVYSCSEKPIEKENVSETAKNKAPSEAVPDLTQAQLSDLVQLPLDCSRQEFPYKPGNVLASADDAHTSRVLHPAFYGCFDWHSAVHGHWMMVKSLERYPTIEIADSIRARLKTNLANSKIAAEIDYFQKEYNYSFERTYGWAWLLKLQQALNESHDPEMNELGKNLQPLSDILVDRWQEFLPKLLYPVRVGTHTNTAFGLSLALDYAKSSNNQKFEKVIIQEAKRLFLNDKNCPISWEPNGTDFLSPCLQELDLMRKILPEGEFLPWAANFLPQLSNPNFDWEVGKIADRTDGHLVHLDGLNFSRAWCMYALAEQYPDHYGHLVTLANKHMNFSLPNLVADSYEGSHWLATFALYAYEQKNH